MNEEENIEDAKEKMKALTLECIELLDSRRPVEAATCYLGLVEQIMDSFGVPPAQIQYAAMAPKHEMDGAYSRITIVPSVDLSAIVNGIPEKQQDAAIRFAQKSFDRLDKCVELWAVLPDAVSGDEMELDSETRHQLGDAFRFAIGAVSLVRQYGYHFNPRSRGPKPCELPDLDRLLTEVDDTGTALALSRNKALRSLMDFVMDEDAFEEDYGEGDE